MAEQSKSDATKGTPVGLAVPVLNPIPAGSPGPAPVPPEAPQGVHHDRSPGDGPVPPADAGHEAKDPVEWATDLVTELGATGTGATKLDVVKKAMLDRFNDPELKKKDPADPARHLTAREALAALEGSEDVPELTKVKARALVETGRYVPAAAAALHDADRIPAPPRGKAKAHEADKKRGLPDVPGDIRFVEPEHVRKIAGPESDADRDRRHAADQFGAVGVQPQKPPAADPKKGK